MSAKKTSYQENVLKDALEYLSQDGTKKPMGIEHWDLFIREYPESGSVRIPVQFGSWQSDSAFYYVVERYGKHRMLYIKQLKAQPIRFGDCYGFFGFSEFGGYSLGKPIMLVEGITDWKQARRIHRYTLCTFGVGVSASQWHILRSLTRKIIVAFDRDQAGAEAASTAVGQAHLLGMKTKLLQPVAKDFGEYATNSDSVFLIERHRTKLRYEPWRQA